MTPYDPTQPSPGFMPSYMPDIPQQTPGQIFSQDAPNLANGGGAPAAAQMGLQGYAGVLAGALNRPPGQAPQMGAPPPPPQLMQGGVHPGNPGSGMSPAALQSMMQIYQSLQPAGQLAQQMQAAGVGTGQGQVPGLLSRFQ